MTEPAVTEPAASEPAVSETAVSKTAVTEPLPLRGGLNAAQADGPRSEHRFESLSMVA